jgi:hypothetical protein
MGNMPVDGGHLIFISEQKEEFIIKEPSIQKYFKKLLVGRRIYS